MCIISGRPQRISDTQILVFPTQDSTHQVTVYSNKVDLRTLGVPTPIPSKSSQSSQPTPALPWWRKLTGRGQGRAGQQPLSAPTSSANAEPVAMVLPFPQGECEMIDTSNCDQLFAILDRWFPRPLGAATKGRRGPMPQSKSLSMLEVKRCGSYQYSVVPTLTDFDRVDESVFKLDDNVSQLLATAYSTEYSFLVCIIDQSAKYQPIAYKHRLRALPAGGHQLFIPTKHEHGNGRADWDHAVYVIGSEQGGQGAALDCQDLAREVPQALAKYLPAGITRDLFRKHVFVGEHPNEDMVVLLPAVPAAA